MASDKIAENMRKHIAYMKSEKKQEYVVTPKTKGFLDVVEEAKEKAAAMGKGWRVNHIIAAHKLFNSDKWIVPGYDDVPADVKVPKGHIVRLVTHWKDESRA